MAHGSRRYQTWQALALHESVAPDKWCVNRADLKYLSKEVWKAIQAAEIQPPLDGSDKFDPVDQQYGPSIYTVNLQHIMPVTEEAGKVSWALMRHPDGLDCQLFISHAWQEGVFEFLSKASTYVLVVPNRRCSIYTRLWCGYEAYRAQEEGKMIFIARASNLKQIGAALASTILAGLVGIPIGACTKPLEQDWPEALLCLSAIAVAAASATSNSNYCRIFCNRLGAFLCGFMLLFWHTLGSTAMICQAFGKCYLPFVAQIVVVVTSLCFFLLLETDRVSDQITRLEALQLSNGFEGTITQAACSEAADKARIFQEIGDKTDAVDHAISVLLTAGMSSPTLTQVSRAGVDIQSAGHAEIALPFAALMTGLFALARVCFQMMYMHKVFFAWIQLLCAGARLALVLVLWMRSRDERCFILKMMAKLVTLDLLILGPCMVFWEVKPSGGSPHLLWFAAPLAVHTVMLALACLLDAPICCWQRLDILTSVGGSQYHRGLGMRRLLSLPCCGRCLLQTLLARGISSFAGIVTICHSNKESAIEGDTDTSTD